MYIPRNIDRELVAWKADKIKKPLLLRGARQVGKSTSVRELAGKFDHFLEVKKDEFCSQNNGYLSRYRSMISLKCRLEINNQDR